MPTTTVRVLPSPDAIGEEVGAALLARIEHARRAGRDFLLGCPTGRTPKPIFAAMARQLAAKQQDLSRLVLVMMDEYLAPRGSELVWAPAEVAWSCHHFARVEIVDRLNASLPTEKRVGAGAVWFPDPRDPGAYDARIDAAGGIDLFLLASGASDGHVAFNPPGSPRKSLTRVIALSEETRRDNLQTFPSFGTLDAVPHQGISVGIETIVRSKAAMMVVWGAGKRATLERMRAARHFEADWPATLIHECADGSIYCDQEAEGAEAFSAALRNSRIPPLFPTPCSLSGSLISLEPLTHARLAELADIGLDPDLWRLQPRAIQSVADMREYIEQALAEQARETSLPFVIVRRADQTVIGSTRFMEISPAHRRLEIGATWLTRGAQRTGANVEAKLLLLRHAFDSAGVQKVVFKTEALNTQSRTAILALGATEEGTFRRHLIAENGRMRDMVYFSILDSEWPRVRSHLEARLAHYKRS